MNIDPVFYHDNDIEYSDDNDMDYYGALDPGWYFWTETWSDYMGPYPTEAEARAALIEYAKELFA